MSISKDGKMALSEVMREGFKARKAVKIRDVLGGRDRVERLLDGAERKCTSWMEDHFAHLQITEGGATALQKIGLGISVRRLSFIASEMEAEGTFKYGYLKYDAKPLGTFLSKTPEFLEGKIIITSLSIKDLYETKKKLENGDYEEVLRLPEVGLESIEIPENEIKYFHQLWEKNVLITPVLATFPFIPKMNEGVVFNTQEMEQVHNMFRSMIYREYHNVFAAFTLSRVLYFILKLSEVQDKRRIKG